MLALESDIEVVGELADGRAAVAGVGDLAPDIVLMDLRMPGMSGVDAASGVHDASPASAIVMLTVSDDDEDVFASIRVGACGYVLKTDVDDVPRAIREAAAGNSTLSPRIAAGLLAEFRTPVAADAALVTPLSERELHVLQLTAHGLPNRELAEELFVSEHTVKTHIKNIFTKLQARSRAHAVALGFAARVLEPPPDPRS